MPQIITVLMGDELAIQIAELRARESHLDDQTFWTILIDDGLSLYRYQVDGEDVDYPPLPEHPGQTRVVQIPVEDEQAEALDALRARRPVWDRTRFWQEALDWGIDLLGQRMDDEDSKARGEELKGMPDGDGLPF